MLTATRLLPTGSLFSTWHLNDLSLNDEASTWHTELPTLTVATEASLPKPNNYFLSKLMNLFKLPMLYLYLKKE